MMNVLSLVGLLLNSVSLNSLSVNFNASYEWHLQAGESITIYPAGLGAFVSTDSSTGQKWDVFVENKYATSFQDSDYSVSFGGSRGHVVITATKDIAFVLHVRFLPYRMGQKSGLVRKSASVSSAQAPAAQHHVSQLPSSSVAIEGCILLASFLALVTVVVFIVHSRRRVNHDLNEPMDISDDDVDNVPPSLPQPIKAQIPFTQQPVQYEYVMTPPSGVPPE
jgi:hypothetical protein